MSPAPDPFYDEPSILRLIIQGVLVLIGAFVLACIFLPVFQ